jgi:hypothetical protein
LKFPKKESEGSSALFFKLKDGDIKTGVLRGEVFEYAALWKDRRSVVVPVGTPGSKCRYRINIVVHEEGKFLAKIWEFSQTICNQLAALAEEYDMSITKIKISRKGSTIQDTEYSIIPTKDQLSAAQIKLIGEVPLNILEHKDVQEKSLPPPSNDSDSFTDANFDEIPF